MRDLLQLVAGLLIAFLVFTLWSNYFADSSDQPSYTTISPQEFGPLYAGGDVHVIDLRSEAEQKLGTITPTVYTVDAANMSDEALRTELASYKTSESYIIYDRNNQQTKRARTLMQRLGFESVYIIDGGYRAWLLYTGE